MTIHFGCPKAIQRVADAVPLYGGNEFASPTRSTIPMLSLLMHAPDLFKQIIQEIGFPSDFDLHLEYTVGPFGGRGKASHTDVMITAGRESLAIEAKWTEPMYAIVKDWPKKGPVKTQNQKAVLQGWLDVLGKRLGTQFDVGNFDNVVYQMIHRAASAAFAGEQPRLAYFLFKPSPDPKAAKTDDILGKLDDLWDLLGKPKSFPFYVVEIDTESLEVYKPLQLLVKGEEATSEAVCAALQEANPLFQFSNHRIRWVGHEARK